MKIANYLRPDEAAPGFPNVKLKLPNGQFVTGLPKARKPYQLIVFWASWCAPCRNEIPELKKLYDGNQGTLAVTSISIDANESQWQKALTQEKMPWTQFLASDAAALARLDKKYDLSAIPVWVLLDLEGKILKRQAGYRAGEKRVQEEIELLLLGESNR